MIMNELVIHGLPMSPGIGIGPPLFLEEGRREIREVHIPKRNVEREVTRYQKALSLSRQDVESLQRLSLQEGPPEVVEILDVHLQMMQDPCMTTQVEGDIRRFQLNTESVFQRVVDQYKERFCTLQDGFFQERLRDIEDISQRILNYLSPLPKETKLPLSHNSIILSSELGPLEMVEMSHAFMGGLVTTAGGITAHPAIIARAKKIPYVANVDVRFLSQYQLNLLIVDGSRGLVVLNPKPETLKKYQKLRREYVESAKRFQSAAQLKSETADGYAVEVLANLENPRDVNSLLKLGAEGVGLFRSEYLYLARGFFPSEEEQLMLYRRMLKKLQGRPLVIRVFDVGADKRREPDFSQIDSKYFAAIGPESNPAIGCRAIRFLLRFPEILRIQLRAILRAGVFGPIQILLPMISDLSELREVRRMVLAIQDELRAKQIGCATNVPLGCMIEVPSSALLADVLAQEADFLSIGTNDLIQYVMAADRNNPHVHELYFPVHPSVLRLIRIVVAAAERSHRPLTLCGESAADPRTIPILLGLGIRIFSVAGCHVGLVKDTLRKWTIIEACRRAEAALAASSASELKELLSTP